jgi:hypothetical protein
VWTGYDAELLDELAVFGAFSYEIVSLGYSHEISQGKGYTALAQEMFADGVELMGQATCTVRVFGQKFTLEDAIEFHAFAPLEASRRVTNDIPLGCPLSYQFTL